MSGFEEGKNITKKIANLNKIPHPKGRKAAQLTKKTLRLAGREKAKLVHQMKLNLLGEKVLWFKENLESVDKYTPQLTIDLIERYLERFNEELNQIELKHSTGNRKSRQHANREDIIKMTIQNERNEFLTSGIEMPDVLNPKQLGLLKNWSGELRYLQNFTLVRYTKAKLESIRQSGQKKEKCQMKEDSEGANNEQVQKEEEKEMNVDP